MMDEASREVTTLCSRREAARAQLDEIRLSFRRDFVASLPLDVLSCIFDEVVALPESFLNSAQGNKSYHVEHALAPFYLAAVCRRWRVQALRQPGLWTYISAPDHSDEQPMDEYCAGLHLQRVRILLQRSKSNAMDISICWFSSDCIWKDCPSLAEILGLVSNHAARWRTFELWFPKSADWSERINVLKGPLPLLETLRFVGKDEEGGITTSTTVFLPFAPKLREITLWGPNALHPSPTSELCCLRRLASWGQLSPGQICSILPAVSQTLQSLAIAFLGGETILPPDTDLVLPHLASLAIVFGRQNHFHHLEKLRMPVLQHLILYGNSTTRHATPFFDQVSATVHTLTMIGATRPKDVDRLKRLKSVRVVRFDNPNSATEPTFGYDVADVFFAAVSRDVWPALASIHVLKGGTFDVGDGSGTLSFIRSRTQDTGTGTGSADSEGPTKPCQLQEFQIETEVPAWFQAEVRRLLQAKG